ncbi:TPA: hypothetical protein DIU22_03665 [Candidatus Woesebacteria bacterium]|nr:hypothetical protein [Candidatus Woesebacteria bacterium]
MTKNKIKNEIDKYLKTQRLMSVATFYKNPWIANVYYIHDSDLNLYFLSKNWREHCVAIKENPSVSVAIADSKQLIFESKKGLQIYGIAKPLNSMAKISWIFKMWNKLISGEKGEKLANPKEFIEAGTSSIYKITPKRIKFVNTELWPKEQSQVLEF